MPHDGGMAERSHAGEAMMPSYRSRRKGLSSPPLDKRSNLFSIMLIIEMIFIGDYVYREETCYATPGRSAPRRDRDSRERPYPRVMS
jgi:hypothetical protein